MKTQFRAMYTIEASLIVPMIVFVIVFIIHLGFMLYGKVMLAQDSYLLAFRATVKLVQEQITDASGYISEHASEQFGDHYFGNRHPGIQASQQGNQVRAEAVAETKHGVMGGFFLMPEGSWEIRGKGMAEALDPPRTIRKWERAKQLIHDVAE